jgi:hypothetical protein
MSESNEPPKGCCLRPQLILVGPTKSQSQRTAAPGSISICIEHSARGCPFATAAMACVMRMFPIVFFASRSRRMIVRAPSGDLSVMRGALATRLSPRESGYLSVVACVVLRQKEKAMRLRTPLVRCDSAGIPMVGRRSRHRLPPRVGTFTPPVFQAIPHRKKFRGLSSHLIIGLHFVRREIFRCRFQPGV